LEIKTTEIFFLLAVCLYSSTSGVVIRNPNRRPMAPALLEAVIVGNDHVALGQVPTARWYLGGRV
jgi:hypothetical protein